MRGAPPAESEREIVARVRRGDAGAFDALVERHAPRALSLACRVMRDPHDAEDLVQDAFVAALARIDGFDPRRPFAPWFFRILVRRGIDLCRARAVRRTEPIPETAAAGGRSPFDDAAGSELHRDLARALDRLSPRQRLVFHLVDVEGFSGAEVAEILEIPDGTVRWHLHEARRMLRLALVHHQRSDR